MDFDSTQFNPVTESPSSQNSNEFAPGKAALEKISELSAQKERSERSTPPPPENRSESLSAQKQRLLREWEETIKRIGSEAYYTIGELLTRIRQDPELYKPKYRTLDKYCKETFGFGRRHANNCMQFYRIVNDMKKIGMHRSQNQLENSSTLVLPNNLDQTKALGTLKTAQEQWQVWNEAIEQNNGKAPSGNLIREIIKQRQQKNVNQKKETPPVLTQGDCQVDNVYTLVNLEGNNKKTTVTWRL